MGDNGFAEMAGYGRNDVSDASAAIDALDGTLRDTSRLMREASLELNRRQRLIDNYQRDNYAHERLIAQLRTLLRDDNLDDARELVEAEYDAIHGPRD